MCDLQEDGWGGGPGQRTPLSPAVALGPAWQWGAVGGTLKVPIGTVLQSVHVCLWWCCVVSTRVDRGNSRNGSVPFMSTQSIRQSVIDMTSVCVCAQPVVHTGMGSLPMRLLLLSICMLCLVHPVGGQGGGVGSPVQRSSPHPIPGNVPTLSAPGSLSGQPFIFIFISFHSVPFLVSGSAGQDPYPNVFISSCFAGMPFLVSGIPLESKFSSTFHACLSRSCLESTASALASSECVRFWIFPSWGQIPGTSGPIPTRDAIKSSGQESPVGTICIGSGCDVCFVRIIEFILFFLTQRDHLHRR